MIALQVKWMQQQHEKVRRKRDGPYQDLPTYSPYNLLRQHGGYVVDPNPHLSFSPESISLASHSQRMEYRDVSSHFIFPDPLFKEQWYLVSKVCNHLSFKCMLHESIYIL